MKNRSITAILLAGFLLVPVLAQAAGGGGVEYMTSVGPDVTTSLGLPSSFVSLPTGAAVGLTGFGYGVTRGGWKIGGFGTFFYTNALSLPVAALDGTLTGAIGGFGGIISGGQGRVGPFVLSLNLRLGAGGMGVSYLWETGAPRAITVGGGTFALFGSVDAELGVIIFPAMLVSAYAGVQALVSLPVVVVPLAVPTVGIRVTWGRF
jgi:hypothetical protein